MGQGQAREQGGLKRSIRLVQIQQEIKVLLKSQ
jgi:hypothetical protein